ncbi:ABC transporter B family member 1 [Micractinium conductrix]|uniref:ABC transporter B family member 1 n=1 Tax=Micractinium conductrix TaxID=554055 RepID=A0A2P6V3Z1_9CHLO|nr:ABC transporter B family member 1 [Micractinium conductrix]|eukprot:PSC68810.1 ABC transporter B family member 1 [Micractinium conductrix]
MHRDQGTGPVSAGAMAGGDFRAADAPTLSSYASLWKYAKRGERAVAALGCVAAFVCGGLIPVNLYLFGELLNGFADPVDPASAIARHALAITGVAAACFVTGTAQYVCLMWPSARLTNRVRRLYFASLLSQDMSFFDAADDGRQWLHVLNEEAGLLQEAMGENLGSFIHDIACFLIGMVVAFAKGWDLSLVMLAAIPAMVIVGSVCGVLTARLEARASSAYAQAGGIALEAITNIRTVAAHGQEGAILKAYAVALAEPTHLGERQGLLAGLTLGATHLVFNAFYALALWYGARRVASGALDGGRVVAVLLSCVFGGFYLGQSPGTVGLEGTPLNGCCGEVELVGVHFAYPARPSRSVFRGLSMRFPPGKVSALVGESGSGKSTIIQLLLRLYEPSAGEVLLDGRNLRFLPLNWLRTQIGLVSQSPTLFATSIHDNIALATGASHEAVVAAAMAANAHNFISKLPKGYDTVVGEKGSALSGGQRQRIAIARAILKNPTILLLDEATSALDPGCEKAVSAALAELSSGRTVVMVAHRLSTGLGTPVVHPPGPARQDGSAAGHKDR